MTKANVSATATGLPTRRAMLAALPTIGLAPGVVLPASTGETHQTSSPKATETNPADSDPIASLPFVRDTSETEQRAGMPPRIFWSVQPTGNYHGDCMTGSHYARLALDYMARENFTPLMQWAVFDMMRAGPDVSGIEVGFLSVFGTYATASAMLLDAGEGRARA